METRVSALGNSSFPCRKLQFPTLETGVSLNGNFSFPQGETKWNCMLTISVDYILSYLQYGLTELNFIFSYR